MSDWSEHLHGWYDRGGLINGLYAVEAAGLRAVDALDQLRQTADYITEHYRDEEEDAD